MRWPAVAAPIMVVGCVVLASPPNVDTSLTYGDEWARDSTVVAALRALAQGLEREIIACVVAGGEPQYQVVIPMILESERASTRSRSCPPGSVARWHNHPNHDRCYMSATDIHAAASARYPWAAVSTRDGELCWWSRDQAFDAQLLGTWMLVPLESQRIAADG